MRSIFNPYLEIHFRLVLSERWNSSEQRFPLNPGLREDEEQSSDQSQVTEQELNIPQDTVRNSLKIIINILIE